MYALSSTKCLDWAFPIKIGHLLAIYAVFLHMEENVHHHHQCHLDLSSVRREEEGSVMV